MDDNHYLPIAGKTSWDHMLMSRRNAIALAVGAGMGIAQARAASDTWAAVPADDTFSNPNNWVANTAPASGDSLNFPASSITSLLDDISGLSVSGSNPLNLE